MVRRRDARVRTVLPVRVFGMDSSGKPFTTLAHTLDITNRGARLGGLQRSLSVGEIVGVQRGTDKARFRVAWIGTPETRSAGQIGLECSQEGKNIWNIIFDETPPDTFDVSSLSEPKSSPFAASNTTERRRFTRYTCDIGLEMQVEGSDVPIFARCTDISRGGCYVETRSPLSPATRIFVCMKSDEIRIRALAEVRSSHPSMGMGVHFLQLGEDDERHLIDVIDALDARNPVQPGSGLVVRLQEGVQSLQRLEDDLARYNLDGHARRRIESSIRFARHTIEACRHALDEHSSSQHLNEALLTEQLRGINSLIQDFEAGLVHTAASPSQLRALRAAAEMLLDKLPDGTPAPPFDTPFIVTTSRPV